MASVEADIANIALGLIGNEGIVSMTENSKEARTCLRFYEQALGEALEAFDWPFARGYARGVAPEGYTLPPGYAYGYVWPTAALAIRGIARDLQSEPDTDYHIATIDVNGAATRLIHTNKAGSIIVYTRNTRDVGLYSPLFRAAAGANLAQYIAMPLTKDDKKMARAEARFKTLLEQAAVSSGNQGKAAFSGRPDPDWIAARGA